VIIKMADNEISAVKVITKVALKAKVATGYDPITGNEKTANRSLPPVGNENVSPLDALRSLKAVMDLQKNPVLFYEQVDTSDLRGSEAFWDQYE